MNRRQEVQVIDARVFPQAIDAERALLGGVIMEPRQIEECAEIVQPTDFYRPDHAALWLMMVHMHNAAEPINLVSGRAHHRGRHARVVSRRERLGKHRLRSLQPTEGDAMKHTRTGRLARLWSTLPFVGKHIAETFNVRRAQLYVLRGEIGFSLNDLCSIPIVADRDPGHAVEWFLDEDYEDAEARGVSHHEIGRIAINLHYDGTFSIPNTDYIDGWRDGLERWRDPKPAP